MTSFSAVETLILLPNNLKTSIPPPLPLSLKMIKMKLILTKKFQITGSVALNHKKEETCCSKN